MKTEFWLKWGINLSKYLKNYALQEIQFLVNIMHAHELKASMRECF